MMNNPRFNIGDLVAVCTRGLTVVIPQTTVIEAIFICEGDVLDATGRQFIAASDCWTYAVSASAGFYGEGCLRPILPGEYDEDTQDLAAPVDGVSA